MMTTRTGTTRYPYWIFFTALPALALASSACSDKVAVGTGSGGGAPTECAAPLARCDEGCVDPRFDPNNCGACGNSCGQDEVCGNAECAAECPSGTVNCGSLCVDTAHDGSNCGACGNTCAAGELCDDGTCSLTCPSGTTQCGQSCVDTNHDSNHCGLCGNVCPDGQVCTSGSCELACTGGTTKCGDVCVDPNVDPQNCGACGNACFPSASCSGGVCSINCNDSILNGYETDVDCGGSMCAGCNLTQSCLVATDCKSQTCTGDVCVEPPDCASVLAINPAAPSDVYTIDPDGPGGASAFSAYCDMLTDGGGWTLTLAYQHKTGGNTPLVETAPLDPQTGYSHFAAPVMQAMNFNEIRLYCETSHHDRKIHFKTNTGAVDYFRGDAANSVGYWNQGFTALAGHDANLPAATLNVANAPAPWRMTDHPFFLWGDSHWNIRAGDRWECDDYLPAGQGPMETTLHQVWVR